MSAPIHSATNITAVITNKFEIQKKFQHNPKLSKPTQLHKTTNNTFWKSVNYKRCEYVWQRLR